MDIDADVAAPLEPAAELGDQPDELVVVTNGIDQLRDLVLAANPNVVPELVQGETLDELIASVDVAGAAYERIAAAAVPLEVAPSVPAGGVVRNPAVDMSALSPFEKISRGVATAGG